MLVSLPGLMIHGCGEVNLSANYKCCKHTCQNCHAQASAFYDIELMSKCMCFVAGEKF